MKKSRGMNLTEVAIAAFFLSLALLGLLMLNRSSMRGAMDAYYEFMAFSLAQEPIEIYHYLEKLAAGSVQAPEVYPLGWDDLADSPPQRLSRPAEAGNFRRNIALTPIQQAGIKAYRISVTVAPRGANRVATWLSRSGVTLQGYVVEKPR